MYADEVRHDKKGGNGCTYFIKYKDGESGISHVVKIMRKADYNKMLYMFDRMADKGVSVKRKNSYHPKLLQHGSMCDLGNNNMKGYNFVSMEYAGTNANEYLKKIESIRKQEKAKKILNMLAMMKLKALHKKGIYQGNIIKKDTLDLNRFLIPEGNIQKYIDSSKGKKCGVVDKKLIHSTPLLRDTLKHSKFIKFDEKKKTKKTHKMKLRKEKEDVIRLSNVDTNDDDIVPTFITFPHLKSPKIKVIEATPPKNCLLYTSPSPRDQRGSGFAACGW